MLVLPVVFLYVDFYVPLVFLGVLLLIVSGFFLVGWKDLKYKIFVDYVAKEGVERFFFLKFFDVMVNRVYLNWLVVNKNLGYLVNIIFGSMGLSIIVVVVLFLFLVFCHVSIKEYVKFRSYWC